MNRPFGIPGELEGLMDKNKHVTLQMNMETLENLFITSWRRLPHMLPAEEEKVGWKGGQIFSHSLFIPIK